MPVTEHAARFACDEFNGNVLPFKPPTSMYV